MDILKFLNEVLGPLLGVKGVTITTNTTAVVGKYCSITALEDTVIASISGDNIDGDTTGINLSAGSTLKAKITGYTLTSGSVMSTKR
jgi:hypothetical protein